MTIRLERGKAFPLLAPKDKPEDGGAAACVTVGATGEVRGGTVVPGSSETEAGGDR